jgi:hypothetical protein
VNFAPECDYVIVNDTFEEAADMLNNIVATEINRRNISKILDRTMLGKFTYHVQVIPVSDDAANQPTQPPPYPEKLLRSDEQPFKIALALVKAAFDTGASSEDIITGLRENEDDYIPPAELSYETKPEGERIRFTYYYKVKS